MSPRDATRKSMDQITGALVGVALVLSAVFLPMAFFGGSAGVIYRQFSLTIVSAMVLVGAGRADPDAGAVRDAPEADRQGSSRREEGFLRLVQPQLRQEPGQVSQRRAST